MQRKIAYAVPFIFLIFLFSCSSSRRGKTVSENIPVVRSGEKILELSKRNNIVKNGVIIKNGKAHLESDFFSGNFDFYVKVNSVGDFFISGKGPLGIEVLRIYCINDSSYVIDRINRKIYAGKSANVLKKFGLPSDFMTLLFGDIPEEATLKNIGTNISGDVEAVYEDQFYNREILIARDFLRAAKTSMNNDDQDESIIFSYDKFANEGDYYYPQMVEIDCKKPLFHVEISISKIECPVNELIILKLPDYRTTGL